MRISDWSSDVCSSDLQEVRSPEGWRYRPSRRSSRADLRRRRQGARPPGPHVRAIAQQEGARSGPEERPVGKGEGRQADRARLVGTEGRQDQGASGPTRQRSEEHTSELQSLMRNSYAVICLQKNKKQ